LGRGVRKRFGDWRRLVIAWILVSGGGPVFGATMYFSGKTAALEGAVRRDDPVGVIAAVEAGANPNQRGLNGMTPLEFSIGELRPKAAAALVRAGANPNLKDRAGDTAVSLAVQAYAKEPRLLEIVLAAGGDANTLRSDGNTVLIRFTNDRNHNGISRLKAAGANLDARDRGGTPLIVASALQQDWDVVWWLIELGARFDYRAEQFDVAGCFRNQKAVPPDSPLWSYKEKVWQHLREHGVPVPPLRETETTASPASAAGLPSS